jgi:pimeloyl-ACP methyl ester carboxylesterase
VVDSFRYGWDGDGDPVLLLHGATGTSLSWAPYTGALAGRAAYALDTIGDVGRSRQTVPVRRPGDLVTWLDETLAGLAIDTVHVAGTSYGGFLGLLLAVHRPERVASLTLLDPGGIERLRLARFLAWGTACLLASRLPDRPRRAAGRALRMPAPAPVLLMVGARSEVHDVRALVERATALLPDVDAEVVAGAGHALPLSHADHCAARLVAFAAQKSNRAAP